MYIKKYKDFFPDDYVKKFNIKQSKKFLQGFILLTIFNLGILAVNLNLEEKNINYKESEKSLNNEERKEKNIQYKSNILELESILVNDNLSNLSIKDNRFAFKIKEEDLSLFMNIINKIGEVQKLTYSNEEDMIQVEGRIK